MKDDFEHSRNYIAGTLQGNFQHFSITGCDIILLLVKHDRKG